MQANAQLIERYAALASAIGRAWRLATTPRLHFSDGSTSRRRRRPLMWRMLCTSGRDLVIEPAASPLDERRQARTGTRYTFSATAARCSTGSTHASSSATG